MAITTLDEFNRANGAPGSNWSQAISTYSVPNIVSNELDWPQFPSLAWTQSQFAANQGGQWQLKNGAESVYILLRLGNLNSGSETGYIVYGGWGGTGPAEAWRMTAGLASIVSLGFENGVMLTTDKWIRAVAEGSSLRILGSSDGNSWFVRKSWSDSSITSAGYVGAIHFNNSTVGTLDNFGAGTFSSLPVRELVPMTSRGVGW